MTRKHCTETGSPCIAQSLEFSFPLTARGTLSFQQPTAQLTFIRRLREFVPFALTPLARFPLRAYVSFCRKGFIKRPILATNHALTRNTIS